METHTLTLDLPKSLYESVHRVAEATGRSTESVVQSMLVHALPPLDDVSEDEATLLAALALLDDAALWRVARSALQPSVQNQLQTLLEAQNERELSSEQQSELETLLEEYGALTVRKAHAYLLLARRGYQINSDLS